MKILVVGYGSIGKRHVKNLSSLNQTQVSVCSKNKETWKLEKKGIKTFTTIEQALKEKHDVAIICNETSLHIKTAIKLADNGYHIFLEKPISNSLKNIPALIKIIKRKKLITMVGCNMRFHHGIKLMKSLIDKNEIGRILSVTVENGSFMPDWHPWEDYQISYASQKKLGGGVVLTQIHEIDYLYWFFGKVDDIYSFTEKLTDLQIDVEDYSGSLLKFKNKIIAELHLDYFQKPSVRSCKIIGTKGQITWNWENNHVQIFKNKDKKWVTKNIEKSLIETKCLSMNYNIFSNVLKREKSL